MNDEKGMTLIELITVIAILGIISCITVPCFGNLSLKNQDTLLETATKELMSDLRLAQQKAYAEGCTYHIYFNRTDNSYMIYSYKETSNNVYKRKNLPAGIRYDFVRSTFSNNRISFNSKGHAVPYPCTVSLINNFNKYNKITITVGTYYISTRN